MAITVVTADNFEKEVLLAASTVLVDFWADWCGPCRMVSPIIDQIAEERPDVKVCKVNIDEQPDLAARYQVMSIPSLLVFRQGQVSQTAVGARPKAAILELIG